MSAEHEDQTEETTGAMLPSVAATLPTGPAEVGPDDLRGLSDIEQFVRVFSAPRSGTRLWDQWQRAANDTARAVMEHLAEQGAEQNGISLEESRRQLAAEKLLNDLGPDYAARIMQSYRAQQFAASRTLHPMFPRPKKKK